LVPKVAWSHYALHITDNGSAKAWVAEKGLRSRLSTEEDPMAKLLFTCPKTNQQAPTGIETDVQSLSATWKATLKVNCPLCGEVHHISVRQAYINGAPEDSTKRLRA
jgi:hypothetical protein